MLDVAISLGFLLSTHCGFNQIWQEVKFCFFSIKYQLMACHVLRNGILSFDMKIICDLALITMSIP